jgi:hypothetical protein
MMRGKSYGELAVHKMIGDSPLYAITHMPTGYAVKQNLDREMAEFFASRLCLLPVWDFKRPSSALRIAAKIKAAWKKCNADWKRFQDAGKAARA